MWRCLAPTTYANLKSAKNASYFASLLEALNSSRRAYSIIRCFGSDEVRIRPAPHLWSFEDLSTYNSYVRAGCDAIEHSAAVELNLRSISFSSLGVRLTMKSTITCPLKVV